MNGELVSIEGVDGAAMADAARSRTMARERRRRGGVSTWDASGVFEELAVADTTAGKPSARTLLVLYAADLAFRIRWEVRPALAEGRTVIATHWIDTAVAFGRAAGIPAEWLDNLFAFAPRPAWSVYILDRPRGARARGPAGFVDFASHHTVPCGSWTRRQLVDRVRAEVERMAVRQSAPLTRLTPPGTLRADLRAPSPVGFASRPIRV